MDDISAELRKEMSEIFYGKNIKWKL
jgi:hypothetical protein